MLLDAPSAGVPVCAGADASGAIAGAMLSAALDAVAAGAWAGAGATGGSEVRFSPPPGAAMRGGEFFDEGTFGGLATLSGASLAAGTRVNFLVGTGWMDVAAPRGLVAALAARRRFSSSLKAW